MRIHWKPAWIVGAALSLAASSARAQTCPTATYPGADWDTSLVATTAATKQADINKLEQLMFTRATPESDRAGIRTDGLVIIKGGKLIYEKYADAQGWSADKRHLMWSVSKSVSEATIGIAVHQGKLVVGDSVCKWYRAQIPDSNCGITVQHLLEMGSGLDWTELYEDKSNQDSSVLAMIYGQGRSDMALFTLSHTAAGPPGSRWRYSTGESTVLSAIAGQALSADHGDKWPWKVLFDPIGAKKVTWERDPAGNYIGGSYVHFTPRDAARFGWLYRNDGCWNGTRLLPEGWVAESTTKLNASFLKVRDDYGKGDRYGRQWWLNLPFTNADTEETDALAYPDAPQDLFAALGHWGQQIWVIPSQDMVVVRVGDDRDGSYDMEKRNEMLKLAITIGSLQ